MRSSLSSTLDLEQVESGRGFSTLLGRFFIKVAAGHQNITRGVDLPRESH